MPPVVVAAGIGAAAGIGGGILSANAQKKAASKAADSAQQTAAQNNALQQQIYNSNVGYLSPYVNRGNEAGSAINALLGIAGTGAQGTQQYGPAIPLGGGGTSTLDQILAMQHDGTAGNFGPALQQYIGANPQAPTGYNGPTLAQIYAMQNDGIRGNFAPALQAYQAAQQAAPAPAPATGTPAAGGTVTNPQQNYQNAFNNYLNSTGYQFQLGQGEKAINQGYAARNSLQSGAALKALQTYGQNTATGFFKDYLGLLSNQQGVGLSGASAIAGVGQGYANAANANNNAAGDARANAALLAGNANANMWGNIGGALGGVANVFGSSYGQPSGSGGIVVNQRNLPGYGYGG